MKIAPYDKKDKEEVREFISSILEDIFKAPAKGLEDLEDIGKNFAVFLVAKEGKEIIGTAGLKKDGKDARISRMYVAESERGKGLGRKMIEKILGYCEGRFGRVFLTTYEQMNSVKFYEKMGFRTFRRDKDVFWMEKDIE